MLEFATRCGARRFLLISSGAVYGSHSPAPEKIPEGFGCAPDSMDPAFAYGHAKRAAESLCALSSEAESLVITVARCFSFLGPHMPLRARLAAGNFLADALAGTCVRVTGDGTAIRSYMYPSDLSVWLWRILHAGRSGRAYNVGSEASITLLELATMIARSCDPPVDVVVSGEPSRGRAFQHYVPSTLRARDELGLEETVPLDHAVRRTLDVLGAAPARRLDTVPGDEG